MNEPLRPSRCLPVPFGAAVKGFSHPTGACDVTGITGDSRAIRGGDVYCAVPGANVHGAQFARQAVDAGAVAIITDAAGAEQCAQLAVPVAAVSDVREAMAHAAARIYHHPARDLTGFGVTGTNGKTTVTFMIDAALRSLGHQTGMVGTVTTRVADEVYRSVRTTPESYDLHALLAVMRERGATHYSLEVSSHAIALHRVSGLSLNVAAFTNLSQDHLDFHSDMDHYFATKARLFRPDRSSHAVIWADGPWGERALQAAQTPADVVGFSPRAGAWQVESVRPLRGGSSFTLTHPERGSFDARSPLAGDFNVANTAIAILMLARGGIEMDDAVGAVGAAGGVPGRMERISDDPCGPLAVVDFAHSPESIELACDTLRSRTRGQLIVVCGAGGDRDSTKRPLMGAALARGADVVIITDDNPRSEEPAQIRAQVLHGAREAGGAEITEIADRAEAIAAAVERASGPEDTILIAGKGHEQGQEVAGVMTPFDDAQQVRHALQGAGLAVVEPS